jgi:hypothetical protein
MKLVRPAGFKPTTFIAKRAWVGTVGIGGESGPGLSKIDGVPLPKLESGSFKNQFFNGYKLLTNKMKFKAKNL